MAGPRRWCSSAPRARARHCSARGIVRRWSQVLSGESVAYLTALDFARDLQTARSEGTLGEFRNHLRRCQVLVIEDLHKLPAKTAIQTELRELLDVLCDRGATVLCTSQSSPTTQQQLEPGLRDRLTGGLLLWLNHPGLAARLELVRLAAMDRQTTIDERQLRVLAESVNGSAAHLLRSLREWELSESLGCNPGDHRTTLSCKEVIAVVARYFGLTQSALRGPSRRKGLVFARSVVVYLVRSLTSLSYSEIGQQLGNRDHSTIMHAKESIEKLATNDPNTQQLLEELRRILLAA